MQSKIEDRESKILEWEVLPPEDRHRRLAAEPIFKWVALIMDRLIRIPGVKKRLGLNPILDLVPGFGDIAAALVSVSVLVYGIRRGIPKILLGRMALVAAPSRATITSGAGPARPVVLWCSATQ